MNASEFKSESKMGGPGHDGYAYCADVYCVDCGCKIIDSIAAKIAPTLTDAGDLLFSDSETCPQPIFFGESECAQHCAECGEYMYGDCSEEEIA